MPPLVNGFLHAYYTIHSKVLGYPHAICFVGDLATREACLVCESAFGSSYNLRTPVLPYGGIIIIIPTLVLGLIY